MKKIIQHLNNRSPKKEVERELLVIKKTVKDVFEESYSLFPVRDETKRKLNIFFNKYIGCKEKPIEDVNTEDILIDLNNAAEFAMNNTIQKVFSIWKKIMKTAILYKYINEDYSKFIQLPKKRNPLNKIL